MGDDDAVHVWLRQQHVDALGEREPVLVAHVLAGDLKYLLAADVGHLGQFRHRLDQALHADRGGGVADRGGAGGASAGNCAAGGQNGDVGQLRPRHFRLG